MSLSSNVIREIVCSSDPDNMPSDPILQILGVKKLQTGGTSGTERYRLVLSDGENYYTSAMLGTQLNDMVQENMVEVKSIIQLNRYTCNVIQGSRKIIIILELKIVKKACDVSGKIGEPEQLSDLVKNHESLAPKKVNKPPQNKPYNTGNTNSFGKNPSNSGMGQKQSFNSGNSNGLPSKNVFPISSLTPYQNRWTIRARVTHKAPIKTWSNSRGDGKLFSMDLLDESGEIRATCFNDAVDRFYEIFESGKVYYITKGSLKTANKQYSSLKNDYEMTLNSDAVVELCTDDCDLPTLQFNFKKIKSIEDVNKDALIDVLGVVKSISDLQQITTKATNKQVWKRDISIADQSSTSVQVTIWGTEAEKFEEYVDKNPVVAIKGAKVSDFGGRSLSILNSSIFHINPDIPEAYELRGWYDNGGSNEQAVSLSGQRMEGAAGSGKFKTISKIKDEQLGMMEKPDYFSMRVFCVFFRKENSMYQACPGKDCNKKVLEDNGQYRCEKCDRTYPDFKYRMMLSANVADHTGNQWVTAFQEGAEAILGVNADLLGKYKDEDEAMFDKTFNDACFRPFVFKIRAKIETYQDEPKLKCSVVHAAPVNFLQESKRLMEEIKSLESA